MVDVIVHFISYAVIAYISKNVNVISSNTFLDSSLCFTTVESVKVDIDFVIVFYIAVKSGIVLRHFVKLMSEF